MRRIRRFFHAFPSPWPLIFIIVGTVAVILYGRGYRPVLRPDLTDSTLKPTGLLSATSDPVGSEVYIDGVLRTATNNTINIDPGWYMVTISKEGYISWQKRLRIQGEVVTHIDPFLFPANPSLSPLTTVGIEHPTLSPDGTKIAYVIPLTTLQNSTAAKKSGLWVYELSERTLGFNRDQRQIGTNSPGFNFSNSTIHWSPDSTQIMVATKSAVRLYNTNRTDDFEIVASEETVTSEWEAENRLRLRQQLAAFKQPVIDIATSSARILSFSPDESKILYEATATATIPPVLISPLIGTNPTPEERDITPGRIYVYDSREDKNYFVLDKKELPVPTPSPSPKTQRALASPAVSATNQLLSGKNELPIYWFPTSRHLALALEGKIDILEFDRTNWVTVYSGPFIEGFIAPWPNGSRIIIMTNLNPGVSALPNLYTVNLR